ncbi:outer membrane beta-barrel protein [Acidobacteriota bacterium]
MFRRIKIFWIYFSRIGLVVITFASVQDLIINKLNGQAYQAFLGEQQRSINARYRIGPFSLFPLATFNLGYDNNVFRKPYPEKAVGDYVMRIGFPIDVYLLSGNWLILSLSTNAEYVYYIKTQAHKNWNYLLSPSIKMLLAERFVLSGSYVNSRIWRRPSHEFDIPTFEKNRMYSASLSYDPARSISLNMGYQVGETRHDEEIYAYSLDRGYQVGQLRVNFRLSPERFFFIEGRYAEIRFKEESVQGRDGKSYGINAGIQFPLIARLRGTLSLGYGKYEPQDKDLPAYSGWLGDTSLHYNFNRFLFRIQYFRSMQFSLGAQSFFVDESVGTGVSIYLDPLPIRLAYDFIYGTANYPDGRTDIYRNHTAGLAVRVIRNIGIGVNLAHWERESEIQSWNRKNTYVFVYLDYAYRF